MTKSELIEHLARKSSLSIKDTEIFVKDILEMITSSLEEEIGLRFADLVVLHYTTDNLELGAILKPEELLN